MRLIVLCALVLLTTAQRGNNGNNRNRVLPTETPPPTTEPPTPTPEAIGEHFRPYFFHDNARICKRVPEWAVTNKNNAKMDYYTESDTTPNMIMLVEAWCGTCQSNAHIAGILADRWEKRYDLDLKIFVINKDNERARKKFNMMSRRVRPVKKWVSVYQDNTISNVWDTVSNVSKRNDVYLVDRWGRVIRFLRDGILNRARMYNADGGINWRDVVLHDFQMAKEGKTVCDELQFEQKVCQLSEEWSLNGRSFANLRAGTSLTLLIFIRADLAEFTTNGLLQHTINLAKEWSAPNYVIIVDSHITSTSSIHMVQYLVSLADTRVTVLLDEKNKVASSYYAAPGDLVATDDLGRVLGIYNRVDLTNEYTVEELKRLHLEWNPDCQAFLDWSTIQYNTGPTDHWTTASPPYKR